METATVETLQQPDFSREAFWQRWGETSGLTLEQFELMWDQAHERYTDEPPFYYHNHTHVSEVLWEAMRLSDYAEENGETVNRKVVIAAALFHDADYHLDKPARYDSKEAWSAAIFDRQGRSYGYDEVERAEVQRTIMVTKFGVEPKTIEDKIMVRADIANMGADFVKEFMAKNSAYARETLELNPGMSYLKFAAKSVEILAIYLSYDLSLGDFDRRQGISLFTWNALGAWHRYARETARQRHQKFEDFIGRRKFGAEAVRHVVDLVELIKR